MRSLALGIAFTVLGAAAPWAHAQLKPAASSPSVRPVAPASAEQGPAWATLKPAQREALKPLERDWPGIDGQRKQKWLDIAERFPAMPAEDQLRMQARMAEWAKLTPSERGQVRLNYQEAKQVPTGNRQASWEAYQALPLEQRRELADRAGPPAATAGVKPGTAASGSGPAGAKTAAVARPEKLVREGPQPKLNTVPAAASAVPSKPVAPTVVQAQPGATTTLMSKPPAPPAHQQNGMPKIATTPEFVDKKTLLPQAGAQGTPARAGTAPAAAASRP